MSTNQRTRDNNSQLPVFPPRKTLWESRHGHTTEMPKSYSISNIARTKSDESMQCKQIPHSKSMNIMCKSFEDVEINPEPGILKVQDTVDKYLDGLKACPFCGNDMNDMNIDGDMWVKHCISCDEIHGIDDTSSVYDVKEIINSWKAKLCQCGNDDVEKYELVEDNEGNIGFQCQTCDKIIKINECVTDEYKDKEIPGNISCICGNTEVQMMKCYEDEGEIKGLKCNKCEHEWLLEDQSDYIETVECSEHAEVYKTTKINESRPLGRKEVDDMWDLHESDHITWWRPEGYWHHALIEYVYPESHEVDVMHYNGPSPTGQFIKGKIVKEKLDLSKEKGLLYKLIYDGPCYSRDVTIIRAETRLDETNYSLFSNNCEHFVRWCKTGFECSGQVKSVMDTLKRIAGKANFCFSSKVAKAGIGAIAAKSMGRAAAEQGAAALAESSLAVTSAKTCCELLGVGAIVAIEGISVGRDIYKAHKLKKKNYISQQEFINITVRRSSQGVLGATGAITGAYLGQAVIPIPVVGSLIGCTLGALIGHGLGHIGGYIYASNQRQHKMKVV